MEKIKKISAGIDKVWEILLGVAAVMLVALLVICAATVALRKVISGGFNWSDEAMRFLMVYSTFLTLPFLVSKKKNITIDLTDVMFPKWEGRKKVFHIACEILTLICCLVLLPSCMKFLQQNMNGYSTAMHIPLWLVYLCMPVGLGLSAIASVNNMVKIIAVGEEG